MSEPRRGFVDLAYLLVAVALAIAYAAADRWELLSANWELVREGLRAVWR